ncbi:hypothetical protein [Streptomyces bobili]|uniref:hypothetical protein n=1 Tax=Streptomyces bobili TaxID=67280 RepID=UPI00381F3F85
MDAFVPWMQDFVGAERFSLVINNLETVSPALASGLGTFLKSLVDGWGLPLGGAVQVAFAGNCSGTVFGIHEGYEDAFLVHLGPNAKNFYCWPAEQYGKLTGGKQATLGEYQALLEQGEHFLLEPGDALFQPRRVFHVGTQETFSISVAMPLYTYPYAQLLQSRIIPEVLAELAGDGPDDPLNEPSAMADTAAGPGRSPTGWPASAANSISSPPTACTAQPASTPNSGGPRCSATAAGSSSKAISAAKKPRTPSTPSRSPPAPRSP